MASGKAVFLESLASSESGKLELRSIQGKRGAKKLHFVAHSTLINLLACCPKSTGPCCLPQGALHSSNSVQRNASRPWLPQASHAAGTTAVPSGICCTAQISLAQSQTAGWLAHPAVADSVLHLGPATADVGSLAGFAGVTRVVAGIEAYAVWQKASGIEIVSKLFHICKMAREN